MSICGKVMFLRLSVILFTRGGGYPSMQLTRGRMTGGGCVTRGVCDHWGMTRGVTGVCVTRGLTRGLCDQGVV